MSGREIEIAARDGSGQFTAYLVESAEAHSPAVILLHEIFGINDWMRKTAEHFAERGYTALCPDLFWRLEPGVALDPANAADRERALALGRAFDVDTGVRDIVAVLEHLRRSSGPDHRRRIGAVGYCLGGRLAYLTACRTHADACVGYYGVGIEAHLEEAPAISGDLMLHIAGSDAHVDSAAQRAIHAALGGHPKVTLHDYPEAGHAFARPGGANYDADAARLADERTFAFLERHLLSA